jgi:hypothetical protein
MNKVNQKQKGRLGLEIALRSEHLPVSYVSSLLRVLQATLREVGKDNDETRTVFSSQPWPSLVMSNRVTNDEWILQFMFTEPQSATPIYEVSSQTFEAFLIHLRQFLKNLPQPGLWGKSMAMAPNEPYESEVMRRMDGLRQELRRFTRAIVSFRGQVIIIEGDQLQID